jgi:hypothetical protein
MVKLRKQTWPRTSCHATAHDAANRHPLCQPASVVDGQWRRGRQVITLHCRCPTLTYLTRPRTHARTQALTHSRTHSPTHFPPPPSCCLPPAARQRPVRLIRASGRQETTVTDRLHPYPPRLAFVPVLPGFSWAASVHAAWAGRLRLLGPFTRPFFGLDRERRVRCQERRRGSWDKNLESPFTIAVSHLIPANGLTDASPRFSSFTPEVLRCHHTKSARTTGLSSVISTISIAITI